jgi:hypothetical protein
MLGFVPQPNLRSLRFLGLTLLLVILNLVHFETWSSAGILPASAREQYAPTAFKYYSFQSRHDLHPIVDFSEEHPNILEYY